MASASTDAAPAFELPFVVQGPWDDPMVWPDPQILIKRSGAAQPLLDAVRNRLKREPARPATDSPTGAVASPPAATAPAQPASAP